MARNSYDFIKGNQKSTKSRLEGIVGGYSPSVQPEEEHAVHAGFTEAKEKSLEDRMSKTASNVKNKLSDAASKAKEGIKEAGSKTKEGFIDARKGLSKSLDNVATSARERLFGSSERLSEDTYPLLADEEQDNEWDVYHDANKEEKSFKDRMSKTASNVKN
ncbi:MAG: hypothetical protein AB8U44_04365, partial [Aaplasma endosymbiont of Hyalomma asiaticum]